MSRLNPVPRPEPGRRSRRVPTSRRPLPDARYRRPYGGLLRRTGRGIWGFAVRTAAEEFWALRRYAKYDVQAMPGGCGDDGAHIGPQNWFGCNGNVIVLAEEYGEPSILSDGSAYWFTGNFNGFFDNPPRYRLRHRTSYFTGPKVNAAAIRSGGALPRFDPHYRPTPRPLPLAPPVEVPVPALDPAAQPIYTPVGVPEPVPYDDIPRLPGRNPVRVPRPGRVLPGPGGLPGHDPAPVPRPSPGTDPSPVPVPSPSGQPAPGPSPSPGPSITPGSISFSPGRGPRVQIGARPRTPPARSEREVKTAISNTFLKLAWWAINAATESCDLIQAVWSGLPWEVRKQGMKVYRPKNGKRAGKRTYAKPSCQDMAAFVAANVEHLDVDQVIRHIINNQIEDAVFGRLGKLGGQGARNAGHQFNFAARTDAAMRRAVWSDLQETGVIDAGLDLSLLETK